MKDRRKDRKKRKLLLILYLLVCLTMVVAAYFHLRRIARDYNTQHLELITSLYAEKMNESMEYLQSFAEEDVKLIQDMDDKAPEDILKDLESDLNSMIFRNVGLILQGDEILGSECTVSDIRKKKLDEQALGTDTSFISDPYQSSETGSMVMTIFVPVKNSGQIRSLYMSVMIEDLRQLGVYDLLQGKVSVQLLQAGTREEYALRLTFPKKQLEVSAVFHHFAEGNLVVLSQVETAADFLAFQNAWPEYVEWAKDHLVGLYHDEYFQIQRINNQLVDAQRALVRSNVQLEQAVKENLEINAKLEEAKLSAEEAMKKARQASQSKSNFLANMSHDIRTPMNAIVGIASLMEHHLDDPKKFGSYIEKLQYSSQYLLDLINDVLDLSKIENGSLQLKMETMDLTSQIEQILAILRPQTREKRQTLRAEYASLQPKALYGDPVLLRQILMNLLSNAVKYTPENGEIRFIVQQSEVPEKNGVLCRFMVSDTGIGMTPEFQKRIFEPFSRADRVNGKVQGTGLGMAITKNIVDAMGGTIRIESTLHEGSSFTVELFMAYSDHPLAEREMVMEVAEKEQEDRQPLSGMHFLCAEDNALNAEILSSLLELSGASCEIYGDGKQLVEAFAAVRPGEYDAILMDVQMPVMNGYEATAAIRQGANPLGRTIPVIAMTANAFAEDIQRSLDVGMNAHISKPVDLQVLQEVMRKYRQ